MKVIVNDLEVELNLKKVEEDKFEAELGDAKFEVEILNVSNGEIRLSINDKIFTFNFIPNNDSIILTDSLQDYHCKFTSKYQNIINSYRSTYAGETKREKILKSPMPGLITKILVKPGMKIKVGDKLLILEAMKMENEIRSDFDGVVEDILVSEGTTVEKGASLLKISTN